MSPLPLSPVLWEETLDSACTPLIPLGIRNKGLMSYAEVTGWWVPSPLCHLHVWALSPQPLSAQGTFSLQTEE